MHASTSQVPVLVPLESMEKIQALNKLAKFNGVSVDKLLADIREGQVSTNFVKHNFLYAEIGPRSKVFQAKIRPNVFLVRIEVFLKI